MIHLGDSSFRDIAYRCEAEVPVSMIEVKQSAPSCREDKVEPFLLTSQKLA